jgi:hypothetical protein
MKAKEVSEFERLQAQLQSLYTEVGVLSKNKPDVALNKFKLKLVNQVLAEANKILNEQSRPFGGFSQFDEDDLPTNSDVLMILSLYLNCLEKLRADNIVNQWDGWFWQVDGETSDVRTAPPRKLKY